MITENAERLVTERGMLETYVGTTAETEEFEDLIE